MNDAERSIKPYLRHVRVLRDKSCTCPEDSWAPCGAQYEGMYDPGCPAHRRPRNVDSHYPSGCPKTRPKR